MINGILILDHQWLPNQSDFPPISWPSYRAWPSLIMSGFHGAFATGVACQQGTLTLPDTWFRPPIMGRACVPIVETRFLELAMSLLDFSPRIPLGTFSILLTISTNTVLASEFPTDFNSSRLLCFSKGQNRESKSVYNDWVIKCICKVWIVYLHKALMFFFYVIGQNLPSTDSYIMCILGVVQVKLELKRMTCRIYCRYCYNEQEMFKTLCPRQQSQKWSWPSLYDGPCLNLLRGDRVLITVPFDC